MVNLKSQINKNIFGNYTTDIMDKVEGFVWYRIGDLLWGNVDRVINSQVKKPIVGALSG